MNRHEIEPFYENPKKLEKWISEIKSRWENYPKFKVNQEKLKHLAIVCDGNRRAAEKRRLNVSFGHQAGVETIKGIARASREWGIHTISFWVWSTENWLRPPAQVEYIMDLAIKNFTDPSFLEELRENQVRFTHLGRKDRLTENIRLALETLEQKTENFSNYRLNLALDYGGLDEVSRGIWKIFDAFRQEKFNREIFRQNPQVIFEFLDTVNQALPDLIIRTAINKKEIFRTSGFMPLQSAYSGWISTPELFPDLKSQTLIKSIKKFTGYEKKFGR